MLKVSASEFAAWNQGADSDWPARMQAAAVQAYSVLKDDFDFIYFVLNNSALPAGAPYGSTLPVKNTVAGLGLSTQLDNAALYGSSGQAWRG